MVGKGQRQGWALSTQVEELDNYVRCDSIASVNHVSVFHPLTLPGQQYATSGLCGRSRRMHP